MRNKAISYFQETLMNRLNNPKKTPIIIIAQRLHQDDICGFVERNYKDDFKILKIPALSEDTNQVIWEEKHTPEDLQKIKKLNPFYFYSQYQH